MKVSTLYRITYIYLALPLFLFIMSWLDSGIALIFSILFSIAFYKAYPSYENDEHIAVNKKSLIIIFAIASIWCFFAGIGYFYYQSFDYHFRNAVFRDLINYEWPVFYDKANTPMVYYMAFWLFPSLFGKISLLLGASYNFAFIFANIILYLYAVFGTSLLFLLLVKGCDADSVKKIIIVVLGFIFFSGLDIVGYSFLPIGAQPFELHLDWWASSIQYSSHSTSMFWVFNQFIPIGIIILLVYNEKNIKNFGFLIALSLFFAPYPTLSIGIFMEVYALTMFTNSQNKKNFLLNNIFSVSNIIGVFWLLPLVIAFFITNSGGITRFYNVFSYTTFPKLILFYLLEFLLFIIVMYPRYKKDLFFNLSAFLLLLIPLFRFDQQNNFCMRASIPVMIIVTLYALKTIIDQKHDIYKTILVCLIIIGSATPFMEFYRGLSYTTDAKKINLVADDIYTLNKRTVLMPVFYYEANHQFTAKKYKTDFFWQHLAKKTRGLNVF